MTKITSRLLTLLLSFAMVFTSIGWLGSFDVNAAEDDPDDGDIVVEVYDDSELDYVEGADAFAAGPDYIDFNKISEADWSTYGIKYDAVKFDDFILDVRPDDKWDAGRLADSVHANVALSDSSQVNGGYVVDGSTLAGALDDAYAAAAGKRIVVVCDKGFHRAVQVGKITEDGKYNLRGNSVAVLAQIF